MDQADNQDTRICQFAIPLAFMEVPNVIAAAMFGMVVLRASPGSLTKNGPPAYTHYHAWHSKFPRTAFHILDGEGKPPAPPWVNLVIGDPDSAGQVPIVWRLLKVEGERGILWSSTITLDPQTLLALPGIKGVAGRG